MASSSGMVMESDGLVNGREAIHRTEGGNGTLFVRMLVGTVGLGQPHYGGPETGKGLWVRIEGHGSEK